MGNFTSVGYSAIAIDSPCRVIFSIIYHIPWFIGGAAIVLQPFSTKPCWNEEQTPFLDKT